MKILFITSTHIGDAAVSSGILAHLVERHPGAAITVVCGQRAASLFGAVPNLDRVLPIVKRRANLHWLGVWRACVGTRWDLIVDIRSSVVAYLLRTGERRVFRPRSEPGARRVAEWGAVIGLDDLPPPHIWTGPAQEAAAARLLPAAPILALGPTANWHKKIWSPTRFAELVRRLTGTDGILPDAHVAVFGTEAERPIVQPLLDGIPEARRLDLIGKTDLATAAAVLKRCRLFIGNDSGLLYIAIAGGIPALGLFGPSPGYAGDQETYLASWAKRSGFVRTPESFEALAGAGARTEGTLMESLTVEAVEAAARSLWARLGGDAAATDTRVA